MQLQHVKELERQYVLGTYARHDLLIARGSGPWLIDRSNKRYLDFLGGIAVNVLGYNHPRIKQVIRKAIKKPLHLSNLFYHEYQGLLAQRLCQVSGLDKVFFTNSGTEAIEGCLKLARVHGKRSREGQPPKFKILALENSFHGRTFGALSATCQPKYQEPFAPLVPGFDFVKFNDPADLEAHMDDEVCAVILETIQGEGGIHPVHEDFYLRARELTRASGALLITDEIQCGLGRTGQWFAYQRFGTVADPSRRPDLVAVAKPLGVGIPLGAVLVADSVAASIKPGEHGTTFGGGPLACRTSLEFFRIMEEDKLLERVQELGGYFRGQLEELRLLPVVKDIRGAGLMLGVELRRSGKDLVKKLMDDGFIINCTHDTVLRILPPFIIEEKQIDKFVRALRVRLEEMPDGPEDLH